MKNDFKHLGVVERPMMTSLPLDPPPFFLEGEIRMGRARSMIAATLVGLLILLPYGLGHPQGGGTFPSLIALFLAAVAAAGAYFGVRFLVYWTQWARAIRNFPMVGGVHPAARGELPRNSFLWVLLTPSLTVFPLCLCFSLTTTNLSPAFWLAASIAAGIAFPDLMGAGQLLLVPSDRWVNETSKGLDVLKPVAS
jgi:hypothetical protein